ncbi:MAG: bifunctional diaminohydroxyphosphoribosylaminopyrimidine deaminase/5-amino-6-(5-phosphoribosylamino)uracil reductase RibD [Devosiaceae bacterium]
MSDDLHRRYLAAAIRLGAGQLGRTWPNPAVGCLIVRDGVIVGQGATGQGGRPHGETRALADAGDKAHGATAYVSLEPCDHQGKTGPCTQALIEAGIAEVFIALGDPDPRVSGAGVKRLQAAGMHIRSEPFADLRAMAVVAHAGHISRTRLGRPHVTLKLALSADGAIGVSGDGQVAITGAATNRLMHGLRSRMDAIAVGGGTLRADAPKLTVRLPGLEGCAPKRVAFTTGHAPDGFQALVGRDLQSDLETLGAQGITRLLVEGGAKLAQSFLRNGLVDELILLKGTGTLETDAIFPFAAHPFEDLAAAGLARWRIVERRKIGADQMMVLRPYQ